MDENENRSDWIVLKFGGTSVSFKDTWHTITSQIKSLLESDMTAKVWVVVSALSKVTNRLLQCIEDIENSSEHVNWIKQRHKDLAEALEKPEILDENMNVLFQELESLLAGIKLTGDNSSSRLLARVLSYGELLSSTFGFNLLKQVLKEEVNWVDARQCLVSDDITYASQEDKYLNAHISPKIDIELAENQLKTPNCRVVITQGFIATTGGANPTTCVLSRGGGDVSGGLFACLLNARKYEVWTDVHGLFTADPRHVKQARHILELSYREAQELAAMGAKVLHPKSLVPAAFCRIPVEIHNTMDFKNKSKYTKIVSPDMLNDKDTTVMAIAKRLDQVLLTLSTVDMAGTPGFMSKAFLPFDNHGVSVDLVACSQYSVTLTLDYIPGGVHGDTFNALIRDLKKVAQVEVHKTCAVVSIVGRRLRTVLHHMADAFKELAQYNVLLLSESAEDLNLSFVVEQTEDIDILVAKLHKVLLEEKRGLPSPELSGSLFGRTLNQLLAIAPSTPKVHSLTPYATTMSIPSMIPELDLNRVSKDFNTPTNIFQYSVYIDLAEFIQQASLLKYFKLSICSNIKLLKIIMSINKDVIFICQNENHITLLEYLSNICTHDILFISENISQPSTKNLQKIDEEETKVDDLFQLKGYLQTIVNAIDTDNRRILIDKTIPYDTIVGCIDLTFNDSQYEFVGKEGSFKETADIFSIFSQNTNPFNQPLLNYKTNVIGKDIQIGDKLMLPLSSTQIDSLNDNFEIRFF